MLLFAYDSLKTIKTDDVANLENELFIHIASIIAVASKFKNWRDLFISKT